MPASLGALGPAAMTLAAGRGARRARAVDRDPAQSARAAEPMPSAPPAHRRDHARRAHRRAPQRRYRARARGRDLRSARGQQLRAGLGPCQGPFHLHLGDRGEPAGARHPRRRRPAARARSCCRCAVSPASSRTTSSSARAITTRSAAPTPVAGSRRSTWAAARCTTRARSCCASAWPTRSSVDFNTARRLFTLICVLHMRG